MTQKDRIVLLCRARSLLEMRGCVRINDIRNIVDMVLSDMAEEESRNITRSE